MRSFLVIMLSACCIAAGPTTRPAELRDDLPPNIKRYLAFAEEARVEHFKKATDRWQWAQQQYTQARQARILKGRSPGKDRQGFYYPDLNAKGEAIKIAKEQLEEALEKVQQIRDPRVLGVVHLLGSASPYESVAPGNIGQSKR